MLIAAGTRSFIQQRIEAQQAENRQLEAALRPIRRETAEADALKSLLVEFLARRQVTTVLSEESPPAAEAFAELSRLPPGIALTHAEVNGMHVVASGVARSEAIARQMLDQLNSARFIINPRIAKIEPAPATDPYGSGAQVFRLEADLRH